MENFLNGLRIITLKTITEVTKIIYLIILIKIMVSVM